ncbi:MAG: MBL fold metallo-hydrolase, partial [Parcubacteria group bacterium]|nr:MBL fold metallo-hydrolase [Parcubacteria group bacterium]
VYYQLTPLTASVSFQPFTTTSQSLLKIYFLDIGQGDATLIQTPANKYILVDGGPDHSVITALDRYLPPLNRSLEAIILTHPDPDHMNGFSEVLDRYEVKNFLETGLDDYAPIFAEIRKKVAEKNIPRFLLYAPQKIELDNGIYLDVLYPRRSLVGENYKNSNLGSFVARLVYGSTSVLLTGDAEKPVEQELLENKANVDSTILKVAHHGSKDSSDIEFLNAVSPETATISAGKNNKYHHPHLRVLRNLSKVNARVYRTDENGDIILETYGKTYKFKMQKSK